MLRQEVYALDGSDKETRPYTVVEQNSTMRCLQPQADNPHAVFFAHAREVLTYHYERNPDDPRIAHAMTLDVDSYGNVRKALAIGYGRRKGQSQLTGEDKAKQEQLYITYSENDVTNVIDSRRRLSDAAGLETRSYQLTGFETRSTKCDSSSRLCRRVCGTDDPERLAVIYGCPEVPYETGSNVVLKQRRLIKRTRTVYGKTT